MERDRILDFIGSFRDDPESPCLRVMEQEALDTGIPIIRPQTRDLLKVLLTMKKPKRILEVGTAIGFSSVFMAENTPDGTKIDTIENYMPRILRAREYIKESGFGARITLCEGDAERILPSLLPGYDMVFMDAAKGQYINYFPEVMRLLEPEGILISDNVLQDGDIFQSRYAIRRRNHTIHKRIREYLYTLTHHEMLHTVILETGDGIALSVRRDVKEDI